MLAAVGSKIQITLSFNPLTSIQLGCYLRRTLAGDTTFTDTTPITFGETHTPTFGPTPLVYTSDSVPCVIDAEHDVYVILKELASSGAAMNVFSYAGKCAGESNIGSTQDYSTASSITSLSGLLAAISNQILLVSSIVLGA